MKSDCVKETPAPEKIEKKAVIRARVSGEIRNRFLSLAEKKGLSESDFLRYLVIREVENESKHEAD